MYQRSACIGRRESGQWKGGLLEGAALVGLVVVQYPVGLVIDLGPVRRAASGVYIIRWKERLLRHTGVAEVHLRCHPSTEGQQITTR